MKLKKLHLLLLIIVSGIIISCDKDAENDKECIEYENAYVTSVNSPDTGIVGETINIEVNFGVFNGCGRFGKFIETENGNTRTIEVEAKYEGCFCTQYAPIRSVNYKFITNSAGNYELRFKSSPTEFISVNLTIN
ncbi:MAG: hypothetical protein WDZ35_01135 [Crocinitomicaceae bacterium]